MFAPCAVNLHRLVGVIGKDFLFFLDFSCFLFLDMVVLAENYAT